MQKITINQLSKITQERQNKLELKHANLLQKKTTLLETLSNLSNKIKNNQTKKASYRKHAYTTYLCKGLNSFKLEKVKLTLEDFDYKINNCISEQHEYTQRLTNLNKEINFLKTQIKRCLIKQEKYNFLLQKIRK